RAPRRAAAAAWFAPLPPGDRDSRPPPTVSPGAGRRSVLAVMSALMLPTTVSAQSMVITTIIVRGPGNGRDQNRRSEEHTSELQSRFDLVCRLLLEKKKKQNTR